jgi:cell division septum initiation protein DivIVA
LDIQHLVDRLEDLFNTGRHVPMTAFTVVDEQRALELIDQMRISVPEEIEKAKRVLRERDRLIAQANEEAARIRELAKEKSEMLVQRDTITQAAQARAASIIEQAKHEAEAIRGDADQYVIDVLSDLQNALGRTLAVVRNGITTVRATQQQATTARTDDKVSQPTPLDVPAEPMPIERITPSGKT